ncbi:MAG: hypothetical protein GY870_20255 [archaeon]|nr:hypothetical protein [archaeon]
MPVNSIKKHITIPTDLADFINDTDLKLSSFVQKKLRELMKERNYHPKQEIQEVSL